MAARNFLNPFSRGNGNDDKLDKFDFHAVSETEAMHRHTELDEYSLRLCFTYLYRFFFFLFHLYTHISQHFSYTSSCFHNGLSRLSSARYLIEEEMWFAIFSAFYDKITLTGQNKDSRGRVMVDKCRHVSSRQTLTHSENFTNVSNLISFSCLIARHRRKLARNIIFLFFASTFQKNSFTNLSFIIEEFPG